MHWLENQAQKRKLLFFQPSENPIWNYVQSGRPVLRPVFRRKRGKFKVTRRLRALDPAGLAICGEESRANFRGRISAGVWPSNQAGKLPNLSSHSQLELATSRRPTALQAPPFSTGESGWVHAGSIGQLKLGGAFAQANISYTNFNSTFLQNP